MKYCNNCGAQLDDNAKFCNECGTKQEERKMFCAECGAELKPGAKFCMECGTPLSAVDSNINASKNEQPAQSVNSQKQESSKSEIIQTDDDTITVNIKGVPYNLKLVLGHNYGTPDEIPDFFIGQTPVTQILWFAVMDNNPSSDESNPNFPVTNITSTLATSFFVKLQKELGVKFELPTENQWGYAYSGGHKSRHYTYSGSNDLNEVGWTDRTLHPVGELFKNELGLVDMDGHVEELLKGDCKSVYDSNEGEHLNDEDFTGIRFVINIPKEGFPSSSPLAAMVGRLKSEIDKHHAEDEEQLQLAKEAMTWKKKQKGKKFGLVDKGGKWRIPPEFDRLIGRRGDPPYFYNGICAAGKGGKMGFIDTKGNWVIEPTFDDLGQGGASSFQYGVYGAKKDDKWGFINTKGKWVIEPKFDELMGDEGSFDKGFYGAKVGDKWGYIDSKGKWLGGKPIFDEIEKWRKSDGIGAGCVDGDWGPVDKNGNWEPAEDQIQFILGSI